MDPSPTATTPFCANCAVEGTKLTPFRYPHTPPKYVTPRFCPKCLPREKDYAVKARPGADLQLPPMPPPSRGQPFRAASPCPYYAPPITFIWDVPNVLHDAVSDLERGLRRGPVPRWLLRRRSEDEC